MDSRRFDTLTRILTEAANRRGLLGLLATLPLLGGLFTLLDPGAADAKGRRTQRRQRGQQGDNRNRLSAEKKKRKKKKCKPHTKTRTCLGKCGPVKNNCKKTVDCGSCDCPEPCGACFICQSGGPNTPSTCVVDPDKQQQPCGGSDGQVCQPDGACACDADSCDNPTPVCVDGSCAICSMADPCPSGCCATDGSCQAGTTDAVCGATGESCQACSGDTPVCWNGDCVCGDVCAEDCQFTVLQDAIDTLPTGSTIRLCAETYGGGADFGDNQKILTLRGVGEGEDGTILEGQNSPLGRTVDVFNGTTAHLRDLRITGATETGVYVPESTVTLTNCTITGNANNVEDGGGGGLLTRSPSSSATLTNCTVSFNTTTESGGGILNIGGTVTLNDTLVTDNFAGDIGGGIMTFQGTINLNGTTLVDENTPDNCRNNSGTYNGSDGRCM